LGERLTRAAKDLRGLRAILGIGGLTRARVETSAVVRSAVAAAVQFASARRGYLVLRDGKSALRLVSRYAHDGCAPGSGRPELVADAVRRAVTENRSAVLKASPEDPVTSEGIQPCAAMAAPVRGPTGRARGALCVDLPRSLGGFTRGDCNVLGGLADQTAAALDADEVRRRLARHGERELEADFARDIQRGLMPDPHKDLRSCEAGFATLPPAGLGGGLLQLASLADGSHAVLVGQVSGRGAPAALVAVKTGEAFRLLARTTRGAAELLSDLDEAASSGLRHEMRARATVLVLDCDGSRAEIALAGGACMKLSGTGGGVAWCPGEGRPLGVRVPGARPAPPVTVLLGLDPGDAALLLTSGCLNAKSAAGERYGAWRVEAFARANFQTAAGKFAEALAADIERFRANSKRTAEGSIAFIRRKPAA